MQIHIFLDTIQKIKEFKQKSVSATKYYNK